MLADYGAETDRIRSCDDAEECGQVLTGTSCGCTRNLVGRTDADSTTFYALQAEAVAAECELGESTCDCPEADGFACVDHACAWNYVDDPERFPACHADEGFATTINEVSLEGEDLVVSVSYGGGCATHWFTTCWPDGAFMESFPVQAGLELLHEGDEPDPCDAWISEELRLDLQPLRVAYVEGYGEGSGTIVVHLGGFSVDYAF